MRRKYETEEERRAAVAARRKTPEAAEKHRIRQLAYAAQNREQERLRAAAWRAANRERERALHRSYYERNAEAIKERNREYRSSNKDKYREYSRRRKLIQRSCGGTPSKQIIGLLLEEQGGKCACCDVVFIGGQFHVDHVVPFAKGGTAEDSNLQLLCELCNKRKAARWLMEFLDLLWSEHAQC